MKFSQLETRRGNRVKQRIGAVLNGALNKLKRVFGKQITITDASDSKLLGLKVFGKSTQNGTPTPDSPVDIVSVENTVVNVDEQTLSIPYKLCGIPVTSGGNCTDENGQQWICDEIDFARGVLVQRVGHLLLDGTAKWLNYNYQTMYYGFTIWDLLDEEHYRSAGMCNQFATVGGGDGDCLWVGVSNWNIYAISKEWYDKGLDAWKSHLNTNPLEVIYVRITPIEIPLSKEEIEAYKALHTNKPNTTIINNQNAWMEVDYLSV